MIFLRWNLSSLSQLTDPPFYKHTLHACRFRTLIVIITSFPFKLVRRGISSPRSMEKRLWEATPSLLENVSSCTLPPFCHNYFVWGGAYCLLTIIFLAYWMTVATYWYIIHVRVFLVGLLFGYVWNYWLPYLTVTKP